MKTSVILALVITALLLIVVSAVSGIAGFMAWALALNGFMGQETAVNVSLVTYIVLALLTALVLTIAAVLSVRYLSNTRSWNPAGATALSVVVFSILITAGHIVCVIISAVVANALRN
ncbi:MAG: hypothetical protein KF855_00525 [Acidobacteria bacterium]|nr:hypothetical protein [Acidobacteriota bacterium]